jgi:pimeloyl-ACP methyl ester carboxylesterase
VTSFVLIPGAGGSAWYWHRVVPLLRGAGHDAIAVDLPGDDEAAGLPEYASLVTGAIDGRDDVVLVAQSLGGFTAPLAAVRSGVRALVFVNAMIPGAWWGNTGWEQARIDAALAGGYSPEFDPGTYFLHDVPPEVARAGLPYQRPEAAVVFGSACDFGEWPAVPLRAVAGASDRFFPPGFQRKLAADRLGVTADLLPGGHLIALAEPAGLAGYLFGL